MVLTFEKDQVYKNLDKEKIVSECSKDKMVISNTGCFLGHHWEFQAVKFSDFQVQRFYFVI